MVCMMVIYGATGVCTDLSTVDVSTKVAVGALALAISLARLPYVSDPSPTPCNSSTTDNSCNMWMNVSGTLNIFRLLRDPTLCLPQHTVSTFNHLPIPLSKAFPRKIGKDGEKEVDIQAVVLDKDNCFAIPHTDEVHKPYKVCQVLSLPSYGSNYTLPRSTSCDTATIARDNMALFMDLIKSLS
jgi:hypothetical protein